MTISYQAIINIIRKTATKQNQCIRNATMYVNIRKVLPDFGGPTIAIRMGTTGFGDR